MPDHPIDLVEYGELRGAVAALHNGGTHD